MEEKKKLTIEEWRTAKGISREALAAACEVSVPTIYNWAEKPSSIKINQAIALAEALDVSIFDIVFLP